MCFYLSFLASDLPFDWGSVHSIYLYTYSYHSWLPIHTFVARTYACRVITSFSINNWKKIMNEWGSECMLLCCGRVAERQTKQIPIGHVFENHLSTPIPLTFPGRYSRSRRSLCACAYFCPHIRIIGEFVPLCPYASKLLKWERWLTCFYVIFRGPFWYICLILWDYICRNCERTDYNRHRHRHRHILMIGRVCPCVYDDFREAFVWFMSIWWEKAHSLLLHKVIVTRIFFFFLLYSESKVHREPWRRSTFGHILHTYKNEY